MFRRGSGRPDRDPVDDKVQRRLRELAASGPPALPVDDDERLAWEQPQPARPGPPAGVKPRRRRWLRALVVALVAVAVTILAVQIDARRPHGWRSVAAADALLTTWPPRPSDAQDLPLGGPPLDVPKATTYAFNDVQTGPDDPVAYDPCAPIHFVVNDRKAFDGADEELAKAIEELEAATGLVLVDDGDTHERPVDDRSAQDGEHYGDRWSPVLIAWSDGYESPELKGGVAAFAGSQIARRDDRRWYVTGMAVFDGPQLGGIYDAHPERVRAVIMRNLGHVVGLADVDADGELMQPTASDVTEWGPGDRAGLARLGEGQCVNY